MKNNEVINPGLTCTGFIKINLIEKRGEMNMNEQKFCQSCGMPLDTHEVIGTNIDQSKNEDYCVYCFKDGGFTQDVTMEEMINISLEHMKEIFANDPSFNAQKAFDKMRLFFPELKRWKV